MSEAPIDPSACKVVLTRHGAGALASIAIIFPPDRQMAAFEVWGDDVGRLIRLAWEEKPEDPHSDKMPSDGALICAALRDLGILIKGEDEGASWRGALLSVVVDDSDRYTTEAADFVEDNALSDAERAELVALARGERDEMRMGGGAAPLVVITRAPVAPAQMDGPLDGRCASPSALRTLLKAYRDVLISMGTPEEAIDAAPEVVAAVAAVAQAEGR